MGMASWNVLAWSPVIQTVVLSFGTLISFLIAYHKGDVTIYVPFISETGAVVPEMGVFSLGAIIGSFIGTITVCFRYYMMSYYLSQHKKLMLLNKVTFIGGLISMVGLAGVAAFPVTSVIAAHLLWAIMHFVLGAGYVLAQSFLSFFIPHQHKNLLLCCARSVLSVLMSVMLIALGILFPISYIKFIEENDHPPRVKVPGDKVFGPILASSLLEWLVYLLFLTVIFSFVFEFRRFKIKVDIIPVSEEDCDKDYVDKNQVS